MDFKPSPSFFPSISVSLEIRFAFVPYAHFYNFVHVGGTLVSLKLTSGVFSLIRDKLV